MTLNSLMQAAALLAQTRFESDKTENIQEGLSMFFVWSVVIVVALIALWWIAQALKKRAHDPGQSMGFTFTLQDLRDMKEAGQLSDEEFERARKKIIGKTRQVLLEEDESSETLQSQDVAEEDEEDRTKSDGPDEPGPAIG